MARENLSPTLKVIDLTRQQERELLSFLAALNSPNQSVELPQLPPSSAPVPWRSWLNRTMTGASKPAHDRQPR